jgi:DNA-binding FadR family transcriptional regulator
MNDKNAARDTGVLKLNRSGEGNARLPERRQNLTERIYLQLKQSIFDFQLLPGDRFTESEIADLVAASRTPVREALTRLQREGFVEVSFRSCMTCASCWRWLRSRSCAKWSSHQIWTHSRPFGW